MVVLAIVGPTASGKTPLSLMLAERLGGEIVSADSRQMYRYLDIGTAKPSKTDLQRVVHHFVDVLDPDEEFSAGEYGRKARRVIAELIAKGRTPVLVGGSGLYIQSVIDGLFEGPGRDPEIRLRLEDLLKGEGVAGLLRQLREVDAVSFEIMRKEPKARRIMRALEVYHSTGKPLSVFHGEQREQAPLPAAQFALTWAREQLYKRINERVENMIGRGLADELQAVLARGYDHRLNALNTVGYKEMFEYLEGKRSLDETVALIKRNTRRFAKRQLTWFRRDKRIKWFQVRNEKELGTIADEIDRLVRKMQTKT